MGTNQQKQPLARRNGNESSSSGGIGREGIASAEPNAVAGVQAIRAAETTRTETQDTGRQAMERLRTKTIEVPLFTVDTEGIYVRYIEGKLSLDQARILNGLTEELMFSGVELEDGQKVRKAIHTIRWLIEMIK
jgi:hypothetical protein